VQVKRVQIDPESPLTSTQRRYLYATAATTGAAIMIIEILGAKMLAPFVGTSHFVWTAQIAVTLVALSVGYYLGGRMVDRSPQLGRLYLLIAAAAAYLCVAVLVIEPVAYWCLQFRLAIGSLLASTFLFFIPLCLLAMVGPFFIRILTEALSSVGGSVGRLTSISTIGSVVGTVLIGYVLIPFLPNSLTMYFTAACLLLVSAGYVLIWNRSRLVPLLILLVPGLALGCVGVAREGKKSYERWEELHRRNSDFGLLQVVQEKEGLERLYLNDLLVQNTYDTQQKKSMSMFTYMLQGLAHAYKPSIREVLCIGLGVGIVPRGFAEEGVKVDVIEINPAVVPIAERFFDLDRSKLNISIGDGRYFVNKAPSSKYDAIILDAFLGDSCPSHLMTQEAFRSMRRILKPQGVLVINTFSDVDPRNDFFSASLFKTLSSAFASVRIHNAGDGGNTFFVASANTNLVLAAIDFSGVHSAAANRVRGAMGGLRETDPAHGRVLTDDFNPVEFYDAHNRERVRKDLVHMLD
jgi:spermidine synthase